MSVTETIKLLDTLVYDFGFTDESFWRLHHKRLHPNRYPPESIDRFRKYCKKIEQNTNNFKLNSENKLVHERLDFVLKKYRDEGHLPRQTNVFIALAEASFVTIPPHQGIR